MCFDSFPRYGTKRYSTTAELRPEYYCLHNFSMTATVTLGQ